MKADRERLIAVNHWYDRLAKDLRFQFVLWPLLFLGVLNMMMTIALRFPFGLLVVLGLVAAAAIRVPYVLGFLGPRAVIPADHNNAPPIVIKGDGWIGTLNRRYDRMPELARFWVLPVILLVAGLLNMLLTIAHWFPFGLLFLIVVVALVVIRLPYVKGWVEDLDAPARPKAPPALTYQPAAPARVAAPSDTPTEPDQTGEAPKPAA
jgi:hypothetical protein